ncbi:EpsG family protein [Facklamia sp. P13055]|uniref:EpsG family protein n=1 Tax=Facklamia sp. P13055 TaxID=3421952 RepID=UPI003D1732D9
MKVYLNIILYLCLYGFIFRFLPIEEKTKKKLFILFAAFHLIFVQGFRFKSVGGDLYRYEVFYDIVKYFDLNQFINHRFELGFKCVVWVFSNLNLSFQNFLLIISVFTITLFSKTVYEYSKFPLISFVLYLITGMFDFGFSGLRQIISMSLILLSFKYILNKNAFKYNIIVILASLFHKSALIFLLFQIFNIKDIGKIYLKIYPVILICIVILGSNLSRLLTIIFKQDLLTYYSDDFSGFGGTSLVIFSVLLLSAITKIILKESNRILDNLIIITSVSLLFQSLSQYSYLFTRFNLFFYQFIALLVPNLIFYWRSFFSLNNKHIKFIFDIIIFFIFILLSFNFYKLILEGNPHQIIPHIYRWEDFNA